MPHAADSIHAQDPATLTPAMRQYQQYKQQYPDAILFFRIGDFYECFYEDARTVSRVLSVALTTAALVVGESFSATSCSSDSSSN